jgi:formylglycine-generating enzyme required for sulfatase activity
LFENLRQETPKVSDDQSINQEAKQVRVLLGTASFALVRIPSGHFVMGTAPDAMEPGISELPPRDVHLSRSFYLGRYEITQLQYKTVMGGNPGEPKGDNLPVNNVTYADALEFCKRLSEISGLPITLPTEAQWEYACRAGTKTRYFSGDTGADLSRVGWYRENAGGTIHPVGEKTPNSWGLYDMHGNVWEPCIDFLSDWAGAKTTDPMGVSNRSQGAMRGGGWMHGAEYSRASSKLISDTMFGGMGIRIAINPTNHVKRAATIMPWTSTLPAHR